MKRLLQILLPSLFLSASILPAYAVEWPPPMYDMPRVAYDGSVFSSMVDSLKITMGSIVNTGLRIAGVISSVTLIALVFGRLFLGNIRQGNGSALRTPTGRSGTSIHTGAQSSSSGGMRISGGRRSSGSHLFSRQPRIDYSERMYHRETKYQSVVKTDDTREREKEPPADAQESRREVSREATKRERGED